MTVKQAALRLEISVSLTYALLSRGKLKGTRHGLGRGTWRVSEEQLLEYLQGSGRAESATTRVTPGKHLQL